MRYVIGLASINLCGQAVLYDRTDGGVHRNASVVSVKEFNTTFLVEESQKLLARQDHSQLKRYVIVTKKSDAFPELQIDHGGPEIFLDGYGVNASRVWRFAEVIASRQGAVLRIRDGDAVLRMVLSGSDPLVWTFREKEYEIVHIALQEAPGDYKLCGIHVFARSHSEPDVQSVTAWFELLRLEFFPNLISLSVKVNSWFVHQLFPVYYPFYVNRSPRLSDFTAATRVDCANYGRGTHCWLSGAEKVRHLEPR